MHGTGATIQVQRLTADERVSLYMDDLAEITGATYERAFRNQDLDALRRASVLQSTLVNLTAALEDAGIPKLTYAPEDTLAARRIAR